MHPAQRAGSSRPGFVIGICGGSGSGKSTLVRAVQETLGGRRVVVIEQDAYYRHRPDLTPEERAVVNYDHPDSIDEDLLANHIEALRSGQDIQAPIYDFTRHLRRADTRPLPARPCVVVEGILVLASKRVRDLLDLRIFVETDPDLRLIRRIRRDIRDRGRTLESVVLQWERTVRPMHLEFVEPSKRHADLIVPEGGQNSVAIDVILAHIRLRAELHGASTTARGAG